MSISGIGSNGNEYHFRIYDVTNGAQVAYETPGSGRGITNLTLFSFPIYLEVDVPNQRFVLQITNMSGNNDFDFEASTFEIVYLHN